MREDLAKTKRIHRLAGQVRLYIERVLPLLERAGGFPDTPMDRDAKGESNPPIGIREHVIIWENRHVTKVLLPRLEELRKHRVSYNTYQFRDLIEIARYDSGYFTRWMATEPLANEAFWQLCVFVASSLALEKSEEGDPLDVGTLRVEWNPDMQEISDPRLVRPTWRKITAHDGYRYIVSLLDEIRVKHPGITEAAAEVECQKELERRGRNGSIGKIRLAKSFVKQEREGAA